MDKTPLKHEIIMKLAMLKNGLKLLIDSGRYKDRRAHMISDVEYDRRVKKMCLELSNDAIDSMVGAAIINKSPLLRARWKMLRSSVIRELNKESLTTQPQGIEQHPSQPHNPSRGQKEVKPHGVSEVGKQGEVNGLRDQGREPSGSGKPQWDASGLPKTPEPSSGPGPKIS